VTTERTSDRFRVLVILIAFGGLLLRILYVSVASGDIGGDGRYYHAIASLLADGKGFIAPKPYLLEGKILDFAPHPPAWPLTLAGAAFVGLRSAYEQQLIACLVGTGTIVVIAFAGRRIAGETAGLIAAGLAALYPNIWLYERELMSETLTIFGAALTILLAYRFRDRPSTGRAIALGFSCGFIAMTHAEHLLLVGLLLVPLIMLVREEPFRRRVGWAALAVGAVVVTILPWAAYNTARFHTPVLLGTELGITVAVTNCQYTYAGIDFGFQNGKCGDVARATGRITAVDLSKRDDQYLHVGLDYARDHLSRLPAVIAAREGRTWSVYAVGTQMRVDALRNTSPRVIKAGYFIYWALIPAAIFGVVVLRRRRVPVFPLLALAASVTIGTALTYGFTRFRAAAEVAIVLLAAVAIDAVLRRRARHRQAIATAAPLQQSARPQEPAAGIPAS
jgi:4-amino-4-deoxy-L-arabinose transferase-like glycosyltransferase